jgi:hypothetical protein
MQQLVNSAQQMRIDPIAMLARTQALISASLQQVADGLCCRIDAEM